MNEVKINGFNVFFAGLWKRTFILSTLRISISLSSEKLKYVWTYFVSKRHVYGRWKLSSIYSKRWRWGVCFTVPQLYSTEESAVLSLTQVPSEFVVLVQNTAFFCTAAFRKSSCLTLVYIFPSFVISALRSTVTRRGGHAVTSPALNMVASPTFIHNSYVFFIFRFSFRFLSPTLLVRLLGGPSAFWKVTTAERKTPFTFIHLLSVCRFHLHVVL
jgi:hypothetical protein